MSNPKPIYAFTQFTGGTGAVWRSLAQPIPDGILTLEEDTGIVKRGDGVTLYADLPVFFNALFLQDVASSSTAAQAAAAEAAASAEQAAAYAQQAQDGGTIGVNTVDASPTVLTNTGVVPIGVSNQRIVGQISAQNTATGDIIAWDVSALAVRRGSGLPAAMPQLPSVALYYADASMESCILTITISTTGFVITATGLADTNIAWTGHLTFSGTPAA